VHGWRGRTSIRKRLQYDLDYIQRWSFWLDIRILWMTIEHVVLGRITWIPRSRAWWERRQRWP
jgi:lipopolysaccharide/colanic/teichoic acid biosynthesis glycosyltransferase